MSVGTEMLGPSNLLDRLRQKAKSRFGRNLLSMGGAQLAVRVARLAAAIFLSRLLLPADYGLAAIVLTMYELIALFTRNGINAKVVQASAEDVQAVATTAHNMTWVVTLGLMALQVAIAFPIAWIYNDMRLVLPVAAMAVVYLATPMSSMQAAFMQRENKLGRIALAVALQAITDSALTILFALCGLGMWAIVLPKILVSPIWLVCVRSGHAWRAPKGTFLKHFAGWRDIARFSRNVLGVELLSTFQSNIDNLIVGYFLGVNALGLYYFAYNNGIGITLGLVTAAGVAVYPHLCELRGNPEAMATRFYATRRSIGRSVVPIILAQAALAPVYVPIVFGEKWRDAIPVLSIICLSALARPFAIVTSQLLKAVGRPGVELRWQILTTLALVTALVVASQFSIYHVAVSVLVVQTTMMAFFSIAAPRMVLPQHYPSAVSGDLK